MEQKVKNWPALIAVGLVALLLGGILTYGLIPRVKEVVKIETQTVEVPGTCSIAECPVAEPVELDAKATYLDEAIAVFTDKKLDKLTECENEVYDEDQVVVKKVNEDWSVVFSEDKNGDVQYSVDFGAQLKYLDKDVQEKCYKDCDVSVLYREDKNPKVVFECD